MAKLMKIAQIGFVAFAMMIWAVNAIAQVTTTASVTASPDPVVVGQSTTLTAAVTKASGTAIPSGTATFYDGATPLGTVDLNSTAHASLVVSSFGLGNYNITAAHSGFSGSTLSPVAVTVNPVDTVTLAPANRVDRTANPWTVQFSDDGVNWTDVVTFDTPSGWAVGVTRSFSTPQLGQNTTTTLASSASPATVGTPVTFTATVSPSSATGTVTFAADGTTLATVALASGHATFATSALAVGPHSMTAAYGGDANDNPSTSAALWEVINAVSGGTAYYFAVNGSDANDCTSEAMACQTIARAQGITYAPGSSINLRGGDNFTGCWSLNQTNVPSKGDKNNPITIQSYGTGTATLVANCPGNLTALLLIDGVSGVTVQNLKFNGNHSTSVNIWVQNAPAIPTMDTILIQNIDASGVQNLGAGNFSAEIFIAGNAYIGGGCGNLNNIKVLNSTLHGADGVTSQDDNGINGSGCGTNVTNVKYSGNHVFNIGGHANALGGAAANGILANAVQFAELSFNLVHDIGANTTSCGGPAGVWAHASDSVTIKFNEVYRMQPVPDQGVGCDFVAYDLDNGTSNGIIEYNYAHENAGACVLVMPGSPGPQTIRYNICENNDLGHKSGAEMGLGASLLYVYNNTIDEPPANVGSAPPPNCFNFGFSGAFTAGSLIANNICVLQRTNQFANHYWDGSGGSDQTNIAARNNLYFGGSNLWNIDNVLYNSLAAVQAGTGKEIGSKADTDPLLTNPGAGGTCLWTPALANGPQPCPSAYRLRPASPALGAGANLTATPFNLDTGGRDYYGNPAAPNIGAD